MTNFVYLWGVLYYLDEKGNYVDHELISVYEYRQHWKHIKVVDAGIIAEQWIKADGVEGMLVAHIQDAIRTAP